MLLFAAGPKPSLTCWATRLGDVINDWRGELGLEELPFTEGPLLAETLQVPFTYCWSPSLVPKPKDWGQHIGEFELQKSF